jgi:hypothetical protein
LRFNRIRGRREGQSCDEDRPGGWADDVIHIGYSEAVCHVQNHRDQKRRQGARGLDRGDVGDVAPANTKALEKTLTLEEDTDDGDFAFSKPTKGWPVGKYRVEIYVNDDLAKTVKFTIEAAKSEKGEEEESSGD